MNTTAIDAKAIAHAYIATWNETDAGRRRALLREGWSADARYVDPLAQVSGHEQIDALIGAVHSRYPGFRFALFGQPDAHGEQLRFSWTLGPAETPDLIQGTDFAEVEGGRLKRVTGFLDRVPAGA